MAYHYFSSNSREAVIRQPSITTFQPGFDAADNYEDIYEEIKLDPYTQLPKARGSATTTQGPISNSYLGLPLPPIPQAPGHTHISRPMPTGYKSLRLSVDDGSNSQVGVDAVAAAATPSLSMPITEVTSLYQPTLQSPNLSLVHPEDISALNANLPQSPRPSVTQHNSGAPHQPPFSPLANGTYVNPATGLRYSTTYQSTMPSSYDSNNFNSPYNTHKLSLVIPEYHETLRNDIYETKQQLIEQRNDRRRESECCTCCTGKHPSDEVKGLKGLQAQQRKRQRRKRYNCVGSCMTALTVFSFLLLVAIFICFMLYVAYYQVTREPSYYEFTRDG